MICTERSRTIIQFLQQFLMFNVIMSKCQASSASKVFKIRNKFILVGQGAQNNSKTDRLFVGRVI